MSERDEQLRAGAAEVEITPPVGVDLGGGPFGPARAVQHGLFARALCLRRRGRELVLLACDLLGFAPKLGTGIRERVAGRCGVEVADVMLSATHTHGGPATMPLRGWGESDERYLDALPRALADLAGRAHDAVEPAQLAAGRTRAPGLAVNRRSSGERPTTDEVGVLAVRSADGGEIALVINYAAHPVNLHSSRTVTPDFPHYLVEAIRRDRGRTLPVFYLNGPCGDLNPANFTPGTPSGEAARATGEGVAAAALEALGSLQPLRNPELRSAVTQVDLPLSPLPARKEMERYLAEQKAALERYEQPDPTSDDYCARVGRVAWARKVLEAHDNGGQENSTPAELQAFGIGRLGVLGVPGEAFCRLAIDLRAGDAPEPLLIATNANASLGYFPTPDAYDAGAYEATGCPKFIALQCFRPDVLTRVREAAEQALHSVRGDS